MLEATVTSTTARGAAEQACERALDLFLRGAGDPRPELDHVLAADPDFVPAQLLRAGLAVAAKDRAALGTIDAILARLEGCMPRLGERDRMHLAAAHAWRAGAPEPGYDCALAMYAFGLEELGHCARAKAAGCRALAIEPRNPAAIHAVAHALMSTGEPLAGVQWMERRADGWMNDGAMVAHNWWHVALFHLALGRAGRALAIYDAAIAPAVAHSATDAADAAALLWRLHLHEVDVGRRWHPVAHAFALRPMPALWPLVDVHAAMAFAAAGRARELDRLRSALAAGGPVAREVALPLSRALEAYAAGEHAESAATLAAHRRDARRLGGSHVQREIVDLTLDAARERCKRGSPLAA
jgi:hypothetical protein